MYKRHSLVLFTVYLGVLMCSCGGGSSKQTTNPLPAIQSVSPSSAAAGGSSFTVTVSGSNFIASSGITWNGTAVQTTFVNATQLTGAIPAGALSAAGTAQLGVTNPAPGGGQATTSFTISAPQAPVLSSISPSSAVVGGAAFTLTVSGSSFVQNSVVNWNGSNLATTYVSNAQLTAAVPASAISGPVGSQVISVQTPAPGGGTSSTTSLTLEYPLPSISSLSPDETTLGSGGFTLTVTGSNFVNGANVYWNNVSRVTQFVSATELTASILASDVAGTSGSNASVTVQNPSPSAGISNVESFAIQNPVPVISSITPTSATAGTTFQVNVSGSGFVPGLTLQLGSQTLTANYNSASSASALVNSAPVGNLPLTVTNPRPGGGTSNAVMLASTAAGPDGQYVVASVDTSGNVVDSLDLGAVSPTGRYFGFGNYLRDTCLTVATGCTPTTIQFRQPSGTVGLNSNYSVGAVSSAGSYVSSQTIVGGIIREGDLEFSNSCLNGASGCVQSTATLVPSGVYPGATAMSSDGRYIAYEEGNTAELSPPMPLLIFDTCTGAAPGCSQTSISLASDDAVGSLSLSSDGRFVAYAASQNGSLNQTQVTLYDSCLGAAPGCAPTPTALSNASLSCNNAFLSGDAQYVSYSCAGPSPLYLQNTCANVTSGCTSTPQELSLSQASSVGQTAVGTGGRFVIFQDVSGSTYAQPVIWVYDSCTGAPAGCTPTTALVNVGKDGSVANAYCILQGISSDAQFILIYTQATNLAALPSGVTGASYIWKNPLFN
jgi:hypothetical protein